MAFCFAKLLALIGLISLASPAVACDTNPTQMLGALSGSTAAALVKRWWDGGKCEAVLLDGISSGRKEWLQLAVAVAPHTDAWSAESLGVALGSAMQRAPSRVLPLVEAGQFKLEVCYPWDFDDSPEGARRTRLGLPRAIRMFESFRGSALAVPAQKCAGDLRDALARMRENRSVTKESPGG
jgi:hypothetical protein